MYSLNKKRILITEEALRDHEGHWFEYNRATKSAIQSLDSGIKVSMLGHRTMAPGVARELDAIPHFRYTVWDQIYNDPNALKRYFGVWLHNTRLKKDLADYLSKSQPFDLVFAPTVVLHHLLAYHSLVKQFAGQKFDQLVLLLRNTIGDYDSSGHRTFRSTSRFWRIAIRRFQPFLKSGSVRFVTDSERLADEYQELTDIRFEVLPHPSLINFRASSSATDTKKDPECIRVFLPGPSRYEKGTDRLLDALRLLTTRDESCREKLHVVLQWAVPFPRPNGDLMNPDDFRVDEFAGVTLEILRTPLTSDEYTAQLEAADVVILPYRRETYFARISGVAVEAMLIGKPLVYTENTWVGCIAEKFQVGLPISDDVEGVTLALQQIAGRLPELRKQAESETHRVAEYFSAANFAASLLGCKA